MNKKWTCNDLGNNILEFTNDNKKLYINRKLDNRYIIEDILSTSGGFGIIFTARDERLLNRKVLIKAHRYDNEPGLFSYERDISRNERIDKIRAQIEFEYNCLLAFRKKGESRMPNVNNVIYDKSLFLYGPHISKDGKKYCIEDEEISFEEPYIIMQMIDGMNMGEYISKGIDNILLEREYDKYIYWERDVLSYGLELCTILNEFHKVSRTDKDKKYFIYQDLKPDNIILTHDRYITLIDFGAMTLVMDDNGKSFSNWEGAGSPGLGTWGYKAPEMNPEMGMLSRLDARVDIYALGVTLFHLLTGEDPSKFPNEYGEVPLEKLEDIRCTRSTYELIRECTKKDRNERYKCMDEVKKKIYECLKNMKRMD